MDYWFVIFIVLLSLAHISYNLQSNGIFIYSDFTRFQVLTALFYTFKSDTNITISEFMRNFLPLILRKNQTENLVLTTENIEIIECLTAIIKLTTAKCLNCKKR